MSFPFVFLCMLRGFSRFFCSFGSSIESFVFGGSGLGLALADLLPLLRESVDWFEGIMGEQRVMLRSSELETRLSSSDDLVEVEEDTTASGLREVRAFNALGEVYGLDSNTLSKFRDRFQFLERVWIRLSYGEERACHFLLGEVCFYKVAFQCGLRFPIHPFIMELLTHFNIAFGQFIPNSWRIMISCMGIWVAVIERDMIRVDEFTYLYFLKESKVYRYYELMPWVRKDRIIIDLPSSFRYSKSRFFYVFGEEWETPSDEL